MKRVNPNHSVTLFKFFSLSNTFLILIIVVLLLDFYYSFLLLIFGSFQGIVKISVILLSIIGIYVK